MSVMVASAYNPWDNTPWSGRSLGQHFELEEDLQHYFEETEKLNQIDLTQYETVLVADQSEPIFTGEPPYGYSTVCNCRRLASNSPSNLSNFSPKTESPKMRTPNYQPESNQYNSPPVVLSPVVQQPLVNSNYLSPRQITIKVVQNDKIKIKKPRVIKPKTQGIRTNLPKNYLADTAKTELGAETAPVDSKKTKKQRKKSKIQVPSLLVAGLALHNAKRSQSLEEIWYFARKYFTNFDEPDKKLDLSTALEGPIFKKDELIDPEMYTFAQRNFSELQFQQELATFEKDNPNPLSFSLRVPRLWTSIKLGTIGR